MLTDAQLAALTVLFKLGAHDASAALSRWLDRPAKISVEAISQLPLAAATEVLGDPDAPICSCTMAMLGRVTGQLILAFDDASGLFLSDLLLSQPAGTSKEWGEVERSAALETANIIGCAYLNALAKFFRMDDFGSHELVPSPPRFTRDFAESLMQFALMNQAMSSDTVFLTRTEFHIEGAPVNWNLLFVPNAECMTTLKELLPT